MKNRLNLFALPNQTNLLFLSILVVLGLPLGLSGSGFCMGPILPILVLMLTVWDFLLRPERMRARYDICATPLPVDHPLSQTLLTLAAEAEMARVPVPVIAGNNLDNPFVFGTWRSAFVAIPETMIQEYTQENSQQKNDTEIKLRHELAHFVNNDVWLVNFVRSLLKMTTLSLLASWFSLIWLPFLWAVMLQHFPDWTIFAPDFALALLPAEIVNFMAAPRAWSFAEVIVYIGMVGTATWPLILGAGIIGLVEWPRLLQMREIYTDTRVALWLNDFDFLKKLNPKPRSAAQVEQKSSTGWLQCWRARLLDWQRPQWLNPQLTSTERRSALFKPASAFGSSARIGLRAGRAVLLLYLLLTSTFAPGQRGVGSEVMAAFGFMLLAVSLMPRLVEALPSWTEIVRVLAPAAGVYLLVFNGFAVAVGLLLLGIFWSMPGEEVDFLLNATFYAITMTSPGPQIAIDLTFGGYMTQILPGAILVFLVGLPLLLLVFLFLDATLKRAVLSWYGAPLLIHRHRSLFWGISLGLALVIWFGAAPLLNLLAFPWIYADDGWLWPQIGITWIVFAAFLLWGYRLHRHYAYRCSRCGEKITGEYSLGKHCPHDGETALNAWLVVPQPLPLGPVPPGSGAPPTERQTPSLR